MKGRVLQINSFKDYMDVMDVIDEEKKQISVEEKDKQDCQAFVRDVYIMLRESVKDGKKATYLWEREIRRRVFDCAKNTLEKDGISLTLRKNYGGSEFDSYLATLDKKVNNQ
jgi:hypothetical protein